MSRTRACSMNPGSYNSLRSSGVDPGSAAIRYSRKIFNEDRCAPALLWDREGMQFTNIPEANECLTLNYRDGWKLTSA